MYIALLILLLCIAGALFFIGLQKRKLIKLLVGIFIAVLTIFFFWFLSFWGEMLWFKSLGYIQRFWTVVFAKIGFTVVGALCSWIAIYLLTFSIPREKKYERLSSQIIGACIGGFWGFSKWDVILRYWNRVSTDINDPIIGKDSGFYLFVLPFYDILYILLLLLSSSLIRDLFSSCDISLGSLIQAT